MPRHLVTSTLVIVACSSSFLYSGPLPAAEPSEQAPVDPEGQRVVTLAELQSLACRHNPTLLQAGSQVAGTYGKAVEAGLWPNPEVGYLHEQIGVKGTPGEFIGGFVRQELVTGGKLRLSRQKYLHRMKISELQALAQQYRVLNDVAIHYYRTLGAARRVTIRRELLKNAEDNLVTTREMFNVGQANEVALHRANIILQQARLDQMMAENDWRLLWERLISVVGVDLPPGGLQDGLEGEPQVIPWERALQHLHAHSPELGAAWAKQRADMVTLQRERVEPIPNLVFTGSVGRNAEAEETVAGAEISLEVPLFDRNQGTIRQAEADLRRQRGEIRRIELVLKRRLAEQYRHYLTSAQHVRQYQAMILPEARKAYQTLLKSYKEDRVAWPLVLEAEREYSQHRIHYTNHLVAWRESRVAIDGLLLVDGLTAPPGTTPPGHIDSVPKPR